MCENIYRINLFFVKLLLARNALGALVAVQIRTRIRENSIGRIRER